MVNDPTKKSIAAFGLIARSILHIRGHQVLLDADIAELYGVETKVLVQSVKRNMGRFPEDFMFQLNKEEFDNLRSQSVTSSWGGRRYPPYAFTEQGVAMLSGVLKSARAISVNVEIMRTFVQLRKMLLSHDDLAQKLKTMESKYDKHFAVIFQAIEAMMADEVTNKRPIGYIWPEEEEETL